MKQTISRNISVFHKPQLINFFLKFQTLTAKRERIFQITEMSDVQFRVILKFNGWYSLTHENCIPTLPCSWKYFVKKFYRNKVIKKLLLQQSHIQRPRCSLCHCNGRIMKAISILKLQQKSIKQFQQVYDLSGYQQQPFLFTQGWDPFAQNKESQPLAMSDIFGKAKYTRTCFVFSTNQICQI